MVDLKNSNVVMCKTVMIYASTQNFETAKIIVLWGAQRVFDNREVQNIYAYNQAYN